jgi:hypothetical protein
MYAQLWSENLRRRDNLKDTGAGERIILKWILVIIVLMG